MAFDSVFQGPPSDVAAPGTKQSPSLGVDVTNSELYVSAGNGWQAIIGAGDISGSGTTGFVPKFTGSAVIGNSAIDDGITVAGKITSTKPLNVTSVSASTFAGPLTVTAASASSFTGPVDLPYTVPTVLYSAAGTPLPTPTVGLTGARAVVSDATTPTYLGAYVSGGTVVAGVICTGSAWVTG